MAFSLKQQLYLLVLDFDNDSRLGRNDLMTVLGLITDGSLEESEKMDIVDKVDAIECHFECIS